MTRKAATIEELARQIGERSDDLSTALLRMDEAVSEAAAESGVGCQLPYGEDGIIKIRKEGRRWGIYISRPTFIPVGRMSRDEKVLVAGNLARLLKRWKSLLGHNKIPRSINDRLLQLREEEFEDPTP